ncbi:MAG: lipid A deacylase LpxR family protein, partial [Chitinophagaceae bacterium]|nr:lipid A deacylase LpxR family protein [Chitinophagaceae bacterium]
MKTLTILLCCITASVLHAQENETTVIHDSTWGAGLIFDQDFFTPQNQDRNYTMGVSINLNGPVFDRNFLIVPMLRKGADWLFGIRKWHNEGDTYLTSMQLFDGAFTPLNLESLTPLTNDRPYGNVLGIGASRTTIINSSESLNKQSSITSRFVVGVIGTRVAEAVQSYIHRKFFNGKRAVPVGWPTQISDGGEPTLLYQLQYMKPIFEEVHPQQTQMKRMQATWLLETNIGYYTNMASGLSFRIGRFTTPFWKFNNSGMSVVSQAPTRIDKKPEFSFFVQFRGRAVVYNALLQGQFKKNEYELTKEQVNR